MKLVPVNETELYFRKTKNQAVIEEFLASGHNCVMIQDHGHKSAKNAQTCLITAVKRFGYTNVKISVRGDRLFMYKI